MPPSSNTLLLAAAGSAALVLAAKAAFSSSSTSSRSSSSDQNEPLDPDECIQADDVIAIFDDLFINMQSVLAQLSQQIQQIQMAGQSIPEPQLRQLLKGEFERALKVKQQAVFDKHDVDEDCLRDATWEFMASDSEEYAKVQKSVERFQRLYENVSGEQIVGRLPNDGKNASSSAVVVEISKEKLLQAAEVYFDALTNSMKAIVDEAKAQGKNLHDPAVAQEIQIAFASKVNDAGEEALQTEGLTLNDFKSAIEKHSSDPEVGRTLAMLQMKQQQQLMALGIGP